jgi:hypothetical protein
MRKHRAMLGPYLKKKAKPKVQPAQDEIAILPKELQLLAEFRELIGSARMRAASALNSEQTLLYRCVPS